MQYKIFISHAREQTDLAFRIKRLLENDDRIASAFASDEDMIVGEDYLRRINEEIEEAQLFIFLLSVESVDEEGYPVKELRYADQLAADEKKGQIHILPFDVANGGIYEDNYPVLVKDRSVKKIEGDPENNIDVIINVVEDRIKALEAERLEEPEEEQISVPNTLLGDFDVKNSESSLISKYKTVLWLLLTVSAFGVGFYSAKVVPEEVWPTDAVEIEQFMREQLVEDTDMREKILPVFTHEVEGIKMYVADSVKALFEGPVTEWAGRVEQRDREIDSLQNVIQYNEAQDESARNTLAGRLSQAQHALAELQQRLVTIQENASNVPVKILARNPDSSCYNTIKQGLHGIDLYNIEKEQWLVPASTEITIKDASLLEPAMQIKEMLESSGCIDGPVPDPVEVQGGFGPAILVKIDI